MKRYNIVNNTLGWLCFLIAAVTYLLTIEPTRLLSISYAVSCLKKKIVTVSIFCDRLY